jgi:type II secretory pathway pseudopilin PulG
LFEKREEGNRNKGLGIGKAGLIVLTSCMISLILISLVVTLLTSEASAANLSTARARQMAKQRQQQQQQQQKRPAVETTNPYIQQKNSTRPRYIPRGHKHYRLDLSKTMTHQQHIRVHTPAYKPRVKPYILPPNLELKLL